MKKTIKKLFIIIDIITIPFVLVSSVWFKIIRKVGIHHAYCSEFIFNKVGILPIDDHYYQPLINPKKPS